MHSNHSFIYLFCSFLLIGCGSSSTTEDVKEETVEKVVEEVVEEVLEVSCDGLTRLNILEASASQSIGGFSANNIIDKSFMTDSRWSTVDEDQSVVLTLDNAALVKGISIAWLNEDARNYLYDVEISKDNNTWIPVLSAEMSDSSTTRAEYSKINEQSAKYIKLIVNTNNVDNSTHVVEVEVFGCHDDIASNIELNDWYLSIPVDENLASKSESIKEDELVDNYFNHEFFFLDPEGGMVFRSPIEGAKTSTNTRYTRTELREMLRRGNTSISTQGINANNWVFSSAPLAEQEQAGGVDGELAAELSVNHVTTTGDRSQVGRVIIGQIHANDDEPIRVYYRKLPENEKGAIYLAHEILDGDDVYYELIGTRSKSASNPEGGIELNEKFSYQISVVGNQLTFTLSRPLKADIIQIIDMTESGYDSGGQYMYFKAGVYNQNNTGDPKDYVQATFYKIENSHSGYLFN